VRAIHRSASHINEATEGGHNPDLYHLSETWWEADTHPTLDEYTLIAYVLGTRTFVTGRAKGGLAIYKHEDCRLPTRRLPLPEILTDAIALEIGETASGKGKIAIIAYYFAPRQGAIAATKYFDEMATQLRLLEEKGYRTFLFGDSNGDRGKDGEPRNESLEAEILQTAEKKAGHTWMCPENEGNCYTRYSVKRETQERADL
jgi:hypothetical protein